MGELAGEAQAAREDAAAARHLAAANDRDVAEVRGEIRDFRQATAASFNAMRSDLTDLQTEMRTGFTQVRGQLDGAAAGLEQISSRLPGLRAGWPILPQTGMLSSTIPVSDSMRSATSRLAGKAVVPAIRAEPS
jgi:hypothetical protein